MIRSFAFMIKDGDEKNREVENLECLKKINVLRYEFRFKKVTSIFGGVVRGADLYSPVFYLRVLQNGMMAT